MIKQSGLLFLMFITAVYVNNVTQAWTFVRAVSSSPCATFPDQTLSAVLLYAQAVWSNQRRAALIAWPWQEARWSGTGHHLPGERSPFILSATILPLLSFPSPSATSTRKLLGGAAKSPRPNARLIFQAVMHLTLTRNNIPFKIIAGIGIGPTCFP